MRSISYASSWWGTVTVEAFLTVRESVTVMAGSRTEVSLQEFHQITDTISSQDGEHSADA